MPDSGRVIGITSEHIPSALDDLKVIGLNIEATRLGFPEGLVSYAQHLIIAHSICDGMEPPMPRGCALKEDTPLQLPIRLDLIHRGIGVDEPNTQVVILQLLGAIDIVFVASLGVTNDVNLEDVEDRLAMIVEGANSQIITIAIAQSAPLPEAIHLPVGQTSIATELLDQPDVAPKDICCPIINFPSLGKC